VVLLKIKSAGLLRHVDQLTATAIPKSSMSKFKVNFYLVYDLSKHRYLLVDRGFEYSKKEQYLFLQIYKIPQGKEKETQCFKLMVDMLLCLQNFRKEFEL
jgi:hypothetical protein